MEEKIGTFIPEGVNKGKAYAHKKGNRIGDLYHTPKSLIWVIEDFIKKEFQNCEILEPCAGKGAISEELESMGFQTYKNDLHIRIPEYSNYDYLKNNELVNPDNFAVYKNVITNPPFTLWDEFVLKAKTHCNKFMFIGRANYLATQGRLINDWNCSDCKQYMNNYYCQYLKKDIVSITQRTCKKKYSKTMFMADSIIWKHLKWFFPFSRYVDYQTPYRKDGNFYVGCQTTGWFFWDMNWNEPYFMTQVIDVQKYATLGNYDRRKK